MAVFRSEPRKKKAQDFSFTAFPSLRISASGMCGLYNTNKLAGQYSESGIPVEPGKFFAAILFQITGHLLRLPPQIPSASTSYGMVSNMNFIAV